MKLFPEPVTFEDGQRKLYGWLMAGAGLAYSLAVLCGVALVVWGTWPPALDKARLYILAGAVGFGCIGSIAVTLALAVGGPVGRFKVGVSKEGATWETDGRAAPPTLTTTTTVTPTTPEKQ